MTSYTIISSIGKNTYEDRERVYLHRVSVMNETLFVYRKNLITGVSETIGIYAPGVWISVEEIL